MSSAIEISRYSVGCKGMIFSWSYGTVEGFIYLSVREVELGGVMVLYNLTRWSIKERVQICPLRNACAPSMSKDSLLLKGFSAAHAQHLISVDYPFGCLPSISAISPLIFNVILCLLSRLQCHFLPFHARIQCLHPLFLAPNPLP